MTKYCCLICGTDEAQELETDVDGIGRACAGCGSYVITRKAITEMDQHGFTFNIDVSRSWLSAHQGSGVIPVIDWEIAAKLV
jgi:DNA-directed RNA polymerase subunit RPC12/RpoP